MGKRGGMSILMMRGACGWGWDLLGFGDGDSEAR
jgi:hypothetical protein